MSYEKILDALNQELVCVDRAIDFLTRAGGHDLASTNGSFHLAQLQVESEARTIELRARTGAQERDTKRQQILSDLRSEQALLVNAIESILKLAESFQLLNFPPNAEPPAQAEVGRCGR